MKKLLSTGLLLALLSSCYKEQQPQANQVITGLTASMSSPPADGATQVTIVANIPAETVPADYSLNFFSTMGLFYDSQKSSTTIQSLAPTLGSSNRVATAILVSPADTGMATVTVTAQDISRSINLHFVQALPQTMTVAVDKQFITIDPTVEATLTVTLARSTGTPTAGTYVQVSAVDSQGKTVGSFRNGAIMPSDKTGATAFHFSAYPGPYTGPVNFTVTTTGVQGPLTDILTIKIIP